MIGDLIVSGYGWILMLGLVILLIVPLHLYRLRKRSKHLKQLTELSTRSGLQIKLGKEAELARGRTREEENTRRNKFVTSSALLLGSPLVIPNDFPLNFSTRFQRGPWSVRVAQTQTNRIGLMVPGPETSFQRKVDSQTSIEISAPNCPYMTMRLRSSNIAFLHKPIDDIGMNAPPELSQHPQD